MERIRGLTGIVLLLIATTSRCSSGPTTPSAPATSAPIVYDAGAEGVSQPSILTMVYPTYTPEALRNGIQGVVQLTAVVLADGTVGDVAVARSLDAQFGLDAQAVAAMKQWLFNPGMKNGSAVAVRVTVEMSFIIH